MKGRGFFRKVFGGAVAVILITAFVVYLAALPTIEHNLIAESEQRVEHECFWAAQLCAQAYDPGAGTFDTGDFSVIASADLGSRFTLVLPDGVVLFDSHEAAEAMDNHGSRAEILSPGTAVTRFSRTLNKEMTYYAARVERAGELRGYARVSVPVEDREATLAGLQRAFQKGALLATLISLVLAGYFARRVTQPLSEIAGLVTEIGSQRTKRRLDVQSDDEFGALAAAVNRMADDLQGQLARVERDRAEREAIFAALADGLLAVDQDQEVLFINPPARALLGGLEGRLKGSPVWELTRNTALIEVIERCLADQARAHGETRIALADGEHVVEITAVPLAGAAGAQRGCVIELRDVTDLRRLEAVRRDFVSNVSHELKTPLAAMRGYTEVILEDPDMPEQTRRSFLQKRRQASIWSGSLLIRTPSRSKITALIMSNPLKRAFAQRGPVTVTREHKRLQLLKIMVTP